MPGPHVVRAEGGTPVTVTASAPGVFEVQVVRVEVAPKVVRPVTGGEGPPGQRGTSASAELLPARGDYPASTLLERVHDLTDRKAELTDTLVPDLVLWFENQLQ